MDVDVRAVQRRELEILKEVAALCRRHGLRWWADGGTCLGAVRHQGFIPWDDDVDIAMPREDFERFRRIAPKELPEHLAVQDYDRIRHPAHSILKVHDRRTTFVEAPLVGRTDAYTGIFLDIFCYDGYPDPGPERDRLDRQLRFLKRLNGFLRARWSDTVTVGQKVRYVLMSPLRLWMDYSWASRKRDALIGRLSIDDAPWANECLGWVLYPSRCVRQTVELPFEDMMIPCPAGTDEYLTVLYGDYMQPPPPEERSPGHPVAWFSMDRSYLDRWWEK